MGRARCSKTATQDGKVCILIADSSEAQGVCMTQLMAISFPAHWCALSHQMGFIMRKHACEPTASESVH